jgi:exodeoxyribonuclease V alpha subunit
VNAHRIKDGKEPYWTREEAESDLGHPVVDDFVFLEVGSAPAARDMVIEQVDQIANELGISASEILVTSPFRKGTAGVFTLNRILQDKNNPHGEQIRGGEEKPLRVNDIVMNTSNRYARRDQEDEYDVMNGDMGRIEEWDPEKKLAMIDFGEGPMKFQGDDLSNVVPAYAATIHKLQGSQGPGLVLPLTGGQASSLISRNHVYTGMTRAEEKCVMVVDSKETLLEVLARQFKRETTLDLRVGRIEKRLKAAWEQVRDFESKWQEHLRNRDLPKLSRPSSLAE